MITVTVNNTDRSSNIDWESLKVNQAITSQPDKCSFAVRYDGVAKNWIPSTGDVVIVEDDGLKVFGGLILRVEESVEAAKLLIYEVEAVSFEKDLDRYLVTDTYEDVTALYIINSIINDYANRKRIVLFDGDQSVTDETGTSSVDTDDVVYKTQSLGVSLTSGNSYAGRVEFSPAKDLDVYDNGEAGSVDDFTTLWVYIEGGITQVRIRLGNETGGTYTNYLEKTYNVVAGWNYLSVVQDDMTEVGTFDRSDLKVLQLYADSPAGNGFVAFDDVRCINEDSYTMNNVQQADTLVDYAQFNYDQVSQAIRQIAEQTGFDWYIDPDRDLHFFEPANEQAPFSLSDNNGNYNYLTLTIEDDRAKLRNQIFVRGGNELGNTTTEDISYQVDGTQTIFQLSYGYADLAVSLNSVAQTIGIENVSDPSGFDLLYNFQEKTLRFASAPAGGATLVVSGKPYIPVVIQKRDSASVANNGVYEYLIVDKTINSRTAARQRAQAELNAYKEDLASGSFTTYESGLRAGQQIEINSTIRNIVGETYIITRLEMEAHTPFDPVYKATLASTKTYGMIELLIDLLRRENKQITIGGDEVVDVVETFDETITFTETVTVDAGINFSETISAGEAEADYIDDPPIWVAGVYNPTSLLADRKRPAYADRDNQLAY